MIRLLPMLWICSLIRAVAPEPTATMAMTAATPMMIPSMVKADRMRLMRSLISQFNVYRWAGKMIVDAAYLRNEERITQRRHVPELAMWGHPRS